MPKNTGDQNRVLQMIFFEFQSEYGCQQIKLLWKTTCVTVKIISREIALFFTSKLLKPLTEIYNLISREGEKNVLINFL